MDTNHLQVSGSGVASDAAALAYHAAGPWAALSRVGPPLHIGDGETAPGGVHGICTACASPAAGKSCSFLLDFKLLILRKPHRQQCGGGGGEGVKEGKGGASVLLSTIKTNKKKKKAT